MKEKILAIFIFVSIVTFVITNSLSLINMTDTLIAEVENLYLEKEVSPEEVREITKFFQSRKNYIGLTVSHDDITNIEDCFAELEGCIEVDDIDGARITKYRLISFLGHLRRLVGFNIDTII